MNTLQKVYDKLADDKTKLANHNVELSLIVELMDIGDYLNSKSKEFEETINEILRLQPKALGEKKELLAQFTYYKKVLSEVEKSSKDLGVDWKSTVYKSDVDKTIKKINDLILKSEKK